jgi:diaminohydroxyphosphoribosylaminopyrimidine deaminase/5-amino-6-(5-phosphoribosylamino)uracil reductase
MNILHVFVEGGARLASSLIAADLVDTLQVYSAPVILGDKGCTPVFTGSSWTLDTAPRMKVTNSRQVGCDIFTEYSFLRSWA